MRLILVGPPASGKGTQAEVLKEKLSIAHISTGDMFREAIKNKTELGQKASDYIAKGHLVPDSLVIDMVLERLEKDDAKEGFLLDGFPRTAAQAEALEEALNAAEVDIDAVVFVDVPDEVVFDRMTGRRLDPETGKIYAMSYNPPPAEIADRVIQRPDDNPDAVKVRLEKYHAETEPVTEFYGEKGLVKKIDGQQKPEKVTADILEALGK